MAALKPPLLVNGVGVTGVSASVAPAPECALRQKVEDALANLRTKAVRAGLHGDHYGDVLDAQAALIGLLPELAEAIHRPPPSVDPAIIARVGDEVRRALARQVPGHVAADVHAQAWSMSVRYALIAAAMIATGIVGWAAHGMVFHAECAANGIAGHASGVPYCVVIRWL